MLLPKTLDGIVPLSCPAGKFVRLAPEPLNMVDVSVPVDGLNCRFVELTYSVVRLPVVTFANSGYRVAFVVVSSVTVA